MPVYVVRKINMALNESRGLFGNAEDIKIYIYFGKFWKEFGITPESNHLEKTQSCNVLSMISRYAQNSDLASMSFSDNFGIMEEFGKFNIGGRLNVISYFIEGRTFSYIKD